MAAMNDYLDCRQGQGCGETHDHCTDCNLIVSITDRKRCTYCQPQIARLTSGESRCRECAWRHFNDVHGRAAYDQTVEVMS